MKSEVGIRKAEMLKEEIEFYSSIVGHNFQDSKAEKFKIPKIFEKIC